jgi:hypothetical protein
VYGQDAPSWNLAQIPHNEEEDAEEETEDVEVIDRHRWLGRMPPRDMREYAMAMRQEEEESSD